jgi:hypothetical protein
MPANFTINQSGGAGAGTLSTARDDIWRNVAVQLVAQAAGSYTWRLLDKPGGSTADLSNYFIQNPTFTPDRFGTYLVELRTGAGADNVLVLVIRVDRETLSGTEGYALPAFREPASAANYGGNERGAAPALEKVFEYLFNNTGTITEAQLRAAAALLTADLDVNSQQITGVADPTDITHATNKRYVDGLGITEGQLRTAAGDLAATVDVNAQEISNLATPTASSSAATKGYVDQAFSDLIDDELYGVSVDGARTESGGGAATPLAQARFYTDLTLSNTTTLSMAGYRLHCSGTLTNGANCAVHNDGNASVGQTAGTGAPVGELAIGTVGGVNGAMTNSAGSGAAAAAASPSVGGPGGAGGASAVPQPGGSASTVTLTVTSHGIPWSRLGLELFVCIFAGTTFNKFRGGAGGAGGAGSFTGVGGGGGGGGGLGWIRAKHVVNNGRISCRGGAGGPAGTDAGGGGGGGGGLLVIWCDTWTGNAPDCDGGAGGAGNGGGVSGSAGSAGKCLVFVKGVLRFRSGFGANAPDINTL